MQTISTISKEERKNLKEKSLQIRKLIINMLFEAGSGHIAGSLGMADIFTSLYFHILEHNPEKPLQKNRDRLILSNGHIVPAQYASLALAGYFNIEKIKKLRTFHSPLQGHPERERLPGLETTSGPLGFGLGQSAGIARASRMDKKDFRVYCIMSDGEQQEGNVWESAMFSSKNRLNNLTAIIDRNNIQISGYTKDVMPVKSLAEKYSAFGWNTLEINGHNHAEIIGAVEKAKQEKEKPTVIIADTLAGKGVEEIENDYHWHGKVPETAEQRDLFLKQLSN